MKALLTVSLLVSCSFLSYSQPKTEFGINTEGAWFMPKQSIGQDWEWGTKAGFGTGIGVYASRNIFWRFSADIGIAYLYKQMRQFYSVYSGNTNGYTVIGYGYSTYDYGYGYGSGGVEIASANEYQGSC